MRCDHKRSTSQPAQRYEWMVTYYEYSLKATTVLLFRAGHTHHERARKQSTEHSIADFNFGIKHWQSMAIPNQMWQTTLDATCITKKKLLKNLFNACSTKCTCTEHMFKFFFSRVIWRLSFSIHLHFFFILSSASFYFLYVVRMRLDQNPNQPLAVIIPRVATLLYGIEYPFPAYSSAVVVLVWSDSQPSSKTTASAKISGNFGIH